MDTPNTEAKETPPTLSPRGTLQLLLTILEISPSQPLNQATLKNLVCPQFKHANKLLSWLAMRTTTGTLADDVLECRDDPARIKDLLRDRLLAACVRSSGCTREQVEFLGRDRLDPKELKDRLIRLPLVRPEAKPAMRAGVIGCLSTLSDVSGLQRREPLGPGTPAGKGGPAADFPARRLPRERRPTGDPTPFPPTGSDRVKRLQAELCRRSPGRQAGADHGHIRQGTQ